MKFIQSIGIVTGAALLATSMASAQAQQTRAAAEKDPLLKAMLTELDRSMSELQLKGFEKPFFIQYRIEDVDDYQARAEFGASEGASHTHQRIARVTVRVGNYKMDSSGARADGALQLAALVDDPIAIRSALWAATDQAYKAALASYTQKQAELKQTQTPPQFDDFSKQPGVISLEDTQTVSFDQPAWIARTARASGLYRTDPAVKATEHDVQYSSAEFHARATNVWLVTSEGTIERKGSTEYQQSIGVGTQAADGMRLDRSYASTGTKLKELDSEDAFDNHAVGLITSLAELRKAPLVAEEEYHGPVLLSADAAADTLRALLAGGVTATRPKLGTQARTNGPFAASLHARVMPEFMDVVDDPLLSTQDGKSLLGAYAVDEEGVPAQAVKLVNDGKLENYLIGREPIRDFPQSNGHGRAGIAGAPRPAIGVLKIIAKNGVPDRKLQQDLLELGKKQSLPFVYYVQTLGGELSPRLLYRVNENGTRELVRGAQLDDLDQRALRSSLVAAGNDLYVANSFGDVPQTVLAPALLFSDATVRRANEKNEKLPFYPPPD